MVNILIKDLDEEAYKRLMILRIKLRIRTWRQLLETLAKHDQQLLKLLKP